MAAEKIGRVTVPLPQSRKDALEQAARDEGTSAAAFLRGLLYRELRNRAANIPPITTSAS